MKQSSSVLNYLGNIKDSVSNFVLGLFEVVNNSTWAFIEATGLSSYIDFFGSDRVNISYGATAISEQIYYVYHLIMYIELFLLIALLWIIFYALISFKETSVNGVSNRYTVHYQRYLYKKLWSSKVLEFVWTVLPVVILVYIGYPSLVLLYSLEERINPELVVKVIGHQWYWHYEVEGFNLKFDLFDEHFDSSDSFLEIIKFPLKGGVFIRYIAAYPWLLLYLDEFHWNTNSELSGNMILLHNGLSYIIAPNLDSSELSYFFRDSFNSYSCVFDFNSVENSKEYLSAKVGSSIINEELNSVSFDSGNRDAHGEYYNLFNWVNSSVDSFKYKYVWINIDYTGDFVKYNRLGSFLNLDAFSDIMMIKDLEFDSYLIKDYDLLYKGEKRMLEVDNRLILPSRTHIQLLVTSADVIHSFAVPEFGVKIDAIPGRLNQCFIFVKYEGTFFGQCSEICGVDHGYMPIVVEVVNYNYYMTSIRTATDWESSNFYQSGWDYFLVK